MCVSTQFIQQYSDKGETIPWPVAKAITSQLAETVHYVHKAKVALGCLAGLHSVTVTGLTRTIDGTWAVGNPDSLYIKVRHTHQVCSLIVCMR